MKVKDLIVECKKRPTKRECNECPFRQECEYVKKWLQDVCPSEYEMILDLNIGVTK